MAGELGLGLIGGGGAFGRFITSALPLVPGLVLRGVAGSNPERTQRAARDLGAPYWTVTYPELIARPDVDVVAIASPPYLHAEMALAAVRAGKAAFIEKPLATTLDDALLVLDEVRQCGVPATVDYVMRYSPLYLATEQIVRRRVLGTLRRVDFRNDAGDEGLASDHWFWDRRKSGGIFIEHGVHFFDVYGWLVGAPPIEVHGMTLMRDATDQEDVVHADVRYENGAFGSYTHAFDKPSRLESQEGLLVFDRGFVRIHGWTPSRLELSGLVNEAERAALGSIPHLQLETLTELAADTVTRGRGQAYDARFQVRGHLLPEVGAQELYRRAVGAALEDLVRCLRDRRYRSRVTVADGVLSLAVACVAAGTAPPEALPYVVKKIGEAAEPNTPNA